MTDRVDAIRAIVGASSDLTIVDAVETFVTESLQPDATWTLDGTEPSGEAVRSQVLPFSASTLDELRSSGGEPVIHDALERHRPTSGLTDGGSSSPDYRSFAFVPIPGYGEVVVAADEPHAFTEDAVRSAGRVAEIGGIALAELDDADPDPGLRRRLDEIASTLSHDVSQPIGIARGNLEIYRETGEEQRLETIEAALDRITQLAEELETLATTGSRTRSTDAVSVAAVAQLAWELCEDLGTFLEIETDRIVTVDQNVLRHLFENLFRNAIEHGATTVTVGSIDDGIYVEDDGPGIPDEIRDEVFERGFSTKSGHSGDGLSIVHDIVESNGWDVAISESFAGGARFEVTNIAGQPA